MQKLSKKNMLHFRLKILAMTVAMVSIAMAFTWGYVYMTSYDAFVEQIVATYSDQVNVLAKSFSGDRYRVIFEGGNPTARDSYKEMERSIRTFNKKLGAKFIYTMHIDKKTGEPVYGFDASVVPEDSVSFTSTQFALMLSFKNGVMTVKLNDEPFTDPSEIDVHFEDESIHKLAFGGGKSGNQVTIDGKLLFATDGTAPPVVSLPDGRVLNFENKLSGAFNIPLNGAALTGNVSVVRAGGSMSSPNERYLDYRESMDSIKRLLQKKEDFVEYQTEDSTLGSMYSFYSPILNSSNKPVALLGMDVELDKFNEFKGMLLKRMLFVVLPPLIFLALFITLIIEFFMLRPMSAIINDIAEAGSDSRKIAQIGARETPRSFSLVKDAEREIAQYASRMQRAAFRDELTGCYNRRYFNEIASGDLETFKQAILNAEDDERKRFCCGLYMVDLDRFKSVNDKYGHDTGDSVLIKLAEIITRVMRQKDVLIRMGGEEFLAVAYSIERNNLHAVAEKIRWRIEQELAWTLSSGERLAVTGSIGYASYPFYPDAPLLVNLQTSIKLADMGLYYSKSHGRNRCTGVIPNTPPRFAVSIERIESLASGERARYFDIVTKQRLSDLRHGGGARS